MAVTSQQVRTLAEHGLELDGSGYYLDDGTFSSVVRVREQGALRAVKIVDKLLLLKHNKSQSVLNEKRAYMTLNPHPLIIQLHRTLQDTLSLYFVLEYCDGGSLLKSRGRVDARVAALQLVQAVVFMHGRGVVHRDIKPENIFYQTHTASIRLGDFGSALVVGADGDWNAFSGTPEYLCPELLVGQVTETSCWGIDWWALGCTVYWLLTGKILFECATEYLVYRAIELGPSFSIIKECCDCDPLLGEIVLGLVEKDVRKRLHFAADRLPELLKQL